MTPLSEFRENRLTGQFVLVAKGRVARPIDTLRGLSLWTGKQDPCPLCEGNESSTPPEVYALRKHGPPNSPGWSVRVVTNKYPAVSPDNGTEITYHPILAALQGHGYHEVVIETPRHTHPLHAMSILEVAAVLSAIQQRYTSLAKQPRIRFVQPFKNEGERGGASLDHPHSQIIATAFVPPEIRAEYRHATEHRENTGRCLHEALLREELMQGERIISKSSHLVTMNPFASAAPFETWIVPMPGFSPFGQLDKSQLDELASCVRDAVARLASMPCCLPGNGEQFSYNLVIRLPPTEWDGTTCACWSIRIVPRLTTLAGFEIATGIWINPIPPEQAASQLREVLIS